VRLLVVAPDYLSHYLPLSAVARRAAAGGAEVIVATGPGLRPRIGEDGFRWRSLPMSAGSNPGLRPPRQRDDDLTSFLDATRRGMIPTLQHQAEARRHDLLWRPAQVVHDVLGLLDAERPDAIVVDHLCLSARIGLYAADVPRATFVPGHPSQLPVGDEVYGVPVAWPGWAQPDAGELGALHATCTTVRDRLAVTANEVIASIDRRRPAVADIFGCLGETVLYNSPAALRDAARGPLPTPHHFLGSCVRAAADLDADTAAWLARDEPFVYVSFGTFLSARHDVLARVVAALAAAGRRAAVATGTADAGVLGPVPPGWLVRPFLPQVELVGAASAVVCHAGNNTVTEALTAGRPVLALPFSTDQFAIAADLERSGVGRSADPNASTPGDLVDALAAVESPVLRSAAASAGRELRAGDGPTRAITALVRHPAGPGRRRWRAAVDEPSATSTPAR
jgi:UDP:flavonoid glycosyltransferase YjiC (YdhE family)